MIRQDRFEVGDLVTWFNDDYATMTDGRQRFGDGPFNIIKIEDAKRYLRSVGHTQHVHIDAYDDELGERFSGAYFKKVSE